jgi:hypothetical protein
MAEKKSKSTYQGQRLGEEKTPTYYIVNKGGAVHMVTRELVTACLKKVGYRLATDEEIEQYRSTPVQRSDKPIAERWTPEPPPAEELAE